MPPAYQLGGYATQDRDQVLALIEADRLPGQPPATAADLAQALAGRSSVDAGWWAELSDLRTDVALSPGSRSVLGVISYAHRVRDNAGVLLWLHTREDPAITQVLVRHVLARFGDRGVVHAFDFATALTTGLEALPSRRRVTAGVLAEHGFTASDLWRYMVRDLPTGEDLDLSVPAGVALAGGASDDTEEWTITATRDDRPLGQATICMPRAGLGMLCWLSVTETARGQGLGRVLLYRALQRLRDAGARQVILYVDDEQEPGGDRDRRAANHLYDRCGFVEVDRLISFARHRHPGRIPGATSAAQQTTPPCLTLVNRDAIPVLLGGLTAGETAAVRWGLWPLEVYPTGCLVQLRLALNRPGFSAAPL
jgi:GNAT superfamily N-acetyltransferase